MRRSPRPAPRRAIRALAATAVLLLAGTAGSLAAVWASSARGLAGLAGLAGLPGAGDERSKIVYRIPIHGTIDMGLAPYVRRSLGDAKKAGAAFVVLDVNTPGGRLDAAWEIVDAVQDAPVTVYAYVDRAISAGAMIALAATGIYTRPGASIGAATPVSLTGEKAPEKVVSVMRSEFRALAEARGLDPRIAEAMVDEEVELPGVKEKGKLLTLTSEEALRVGYSKGEFEDLESLLAALDAAGAEVIVPGENWAERVVRFLTSPLVAPILLSLGMLGLLIELQTPSFGVAGITGLILLALFFGAHLIVGLAGLEEVLLLLAGLVLLGLEVFLIPGFGLAGILGIVAIAAAIFLALLGRFPSVNDITRAVGTLGVTLLIFMATAYYFVRHLPWSKRLGGIFLREAEARAVGYISAEPRQDLVGKIGVAVTDLRPAGIGLFDGERIDVVSEGDYVRAGARIKVLRSEGYRHIVRPVEGKRL